jgi:hypothetical protein
MTALYLAQATHLTLLLESGAERACPGQTVAAGTALELVRTFRFGPLAAYRLPCGRVALLPASRMGTR